MQKGYIFVTLLLLGLASANYWEISKEFNLNTFDLSNTNGWTLVNFSGQRVSNCAGQSIVGGPGVVATGSMTKSFTVDFDLNAINIQFDLYLFDQWLSGWEGGRDQNTAFKVFVNDKLVQKLGSDFTRQLHAQSSNVCGQSNPDRKTHVSFKVPVTGKQFTIKLEANIASNNANTASWGIRDFYVLSEYGPTNASVAIRELFDDANFDVSKWTSNFNQAVTACGEKVLGGFNAAGGGAQFTRKITNLPPHSFLQISLKGHFIDSADGNDSIVFYIDGKIVHEHQRLYLQNDKNVCGAGWNDGSEDITIVIPHFETSAEFKIYVNYDQGAGDESFGIRNFEVQTVMPCPIIYSENDQKGKLLSFCGSIPNLREIGWTYPIKGIYVPRGLQLTVFEDSKYFGKNYSISKSNFALQGNEYALINKAFKIDISEKKLRRN